MTLYVDAVAIGDIPVLADPTKATVAASGYNQAARPGKCVLSPEMVILTCYSGEDDTLGFEAIVADAQP